MRGTFWKTFEGLGTMLVKGDRIKAKFIPRAGIRIARNARTDAEVFQPSPCSRNNVG